MKKQIDICDWCEKENAVVMISNGKDKGDFLCPECEVQFLEMVRDELLNDLEGSGDWRTAKIKLVREDENGTVEKD